MAEVEVTRDGAVQTITLNRPEVLNAFNRAVHDGLRDALKAARDPEVRAVVLTGAGRGFCAGQDLTEFGETGDLGDTLRATYHPNVARHPRAREAGDRCSERRLRRRRALARLCVRLPHRRGRRELRARVHRHRPRARRRRHVLPQPAARRVARVRVDDVEPAAHGRRGARLGPRLGGRRSGCARRARRGARRVLRSDADARRRHDEAALRPCRRPPRSTSSSSRRRSSRSPPRRPRTSARASRPSSRSARRISPAADEARAHLHPEAGRGLAARDSGELRPRRGVRHRREVTALRRVAEVVQGSRDATVGREPRTNRDRVARRRLQGLESPQRSLVERQRLRDVRDDLACTTVAARPTSSGRRRRSRSRRPA